MDSEGMHASTVILRPHCGRGAILMVQFPGCSLFRSIFVLRSHCWDFESCLLSGIKKRPFLGGWFSIATMLSTIHKTELVHYREVVRLSKGPLSEVRL